MVSGLLFFQASLILIFALLVNVTPYWATLPCKLAIVGLAALSAYAGWELL